MNLQTHLLRGLFSLPLLALALAAVLSAPPAAETGLASGGGQTCPVTPRVARASDLLRIPGDVGSLRRRWAGLCDG